MTVTPKKQVAVVVPLANRAELRPEERISYRHLMHYLDRYDKYLVAAESLNIRLPGCQVERFADKYFGSVRANTRLMLSRHFYERFEEYEYILIYHLDALVFSDQLEAWCRAAFDYIAPPWLQTDDSPWVEEEGVGNGGFSLRKVSSFLKVLDSERQAIHPDEYWQKKYADQPLHIQLLNLPRKYLKRLNRFNSVKWETERFQRNEDKFWGIRATHYYPDFNIAPIETALRFAFECAPALCFERNGQRLPFGCHAWPRYDREFWEPFLLPADQRSSSKGGEACVVQI